MAVFPFSMSCVPCHIESLIPSTTVKIFQGTFTHARTHARTHAMRMHARTHARTELDPWRRGTATFTLVWFQVFFESCFDSIVVANSAGSFSFYHYNVHWEI
jgi:hypothetical protein